jgi:putative FmdB family regulatory protein
MPIYEYVCENCGHKSEYRQSIHDAPREACQECSGKLRRVISGGSGFILKGADNSDFVQPRCGKNQTCCGSSTPCESPHCDSSE